MMASVQDKHTASIGSESSGSTRSAALYRIRTVADSISDKLSLKSVQASGPARIFNPTNVRMRVRWKDAGDTQDPSSEMALLWRARDNRKGRQSIAIPRSASIAGSSHFPEGPLPFTSSSRGLFRGVMRMLTTFPYWDMAFWVAFWFSAGSAIFTVSSLFAWHPLAFPENEFEGERYYLVGLFGIVGVIAYQIGAVLAYLEAVNDGCIHGSFLKRFLQEGLETEEKRLFDRKLRLFVHHMIPERIQKRRGTNTDRAVDDLEGGWYAASRVDSALQAHGLQNDSVPRRGGLDLGAEESQNRDYHRFRWWPTWKNFVAHHMHEIGFLACSMQLMGATIFIAPGIVAMPGIPESLADWELNVAYWIPDIVASASFAVASLMFLLETQTKWCQPNFGVLGWWVSVWAATGSVGFLLCGALGPAGTRHDWAEYHAMLASTWGSACFLVAGLLMWYEAVNKRSITELR